MKKLIKILLSITVVLAIMLIGGRWIVLWQLEQRLITQVERLRESGITIRYSTLDVDPWAGSLSLSGLVAHDSGQDSLCQSSVVVTGIFAEGIRLLPLIRDHKLEVETIIATKLQITYAKHDVQTQKPSAQGLLDGIKVHLLQIDSGTVTLLNNRCEKYLAAKLDIAIHKMLISGLQVDSMRWNVGSAEAKSMVVHLPTEFYAFNIKKLAYSLSKKSIQVDSVRMVPMLDQLAFAQQTRHQIDQIQCTIPRINMNGFNVRESLPTALTIHRIELGFNIRIYRDKRFPKGHQVPSTLPVTFMHKLPFLLKIDSINILPSDVTYVEVPEMGGPPGSISFNGLVATIANITTDSVGESVMQVNSRFMDTGSLDARFVFPMEPGKPNTVRATLSNFSIPSVNKMLLPLESLEIQSGELQSLNLAFQYDDLEATGEISLLYKHLKIRSVNRDQKHSTKSLATLLINTMVQNNMDRTDQKDKRTGTIYWKRDPQSGLPSYWWKSILSGLKSVYSLEKVLSL